MLARATVGRPVPDPVRGSWRRGRRQGFFRYGLVGGSKVGRLHGRRPALDELTTKPPAMETVIAMRKLLMIVGLFLFGIAPSALAGQDPDEYFFDQTFGNLQEELARAREEGKQGVLLFFEMDDCPFCHRMRTTVLNQPKVQAFYREHFLSFPVDIEGDVELTDFSGTATTQKDFAFKGYRVRATPVFLFFDLNGNPVARYTGATSGVDEFMWLGEYVAQGQYEDMPFARYKRLKQAAQRR